MPLDALTAYRPIAVFLVTLALANALYRYQEVKICKRNYLKVDGVAELLSQSVPPRDDDYDEGIDYTR